jgi:uncharacterized membrane protein YbhN (UPF0104 family)
MFSLTRRFGKLLGPAIAAVALGATGNVVLGWLAARGANVDARYLLSLPLFYAAVLLVLVPWITHSLRVSIWADFLGRPLHPADVLRIVLGSEVGAAITPAMAGGGFVKVAFLIERGFSAGQAASLMILGSIEDYAFFLVALPLALVALPARDVHALRPAGESLGNHVMVLGAIAISLIAALLLLRRPLLRRLGRLWHDFVGVFALIVRRGKLRFAATFGLVAVHWTCRYLATALLLECFSVSLNPLLVFILQWIVGVAALAAPTPGAMIGAEAAFYVTYHTFVPARILPAAVAGWRVLTFYWPLALAALWFSLLQWRMRQREPRRVPQQDEPNAA